MLEEVVQQSFASPGSDEGVRICFCHVFRWLCVRPSAAQPEDARGSAAHRPETRAGPLSFRKLKSRQPCTCAPFYEAAPMGWVHVWQNLLAALATQGYTLALVNPPRTHPFAHEEPAWARIDSIERLQFRPLRPALDTSGRRSAVRRKARTKEPRSPRIGP